MTFFSDSRRRHVDLQLIRSKRKVNCYYYVLSWTGDWKQQKQVFNFSIYISTSAGEKANSAVQANVFAGKQANPTLQSARFKQEHWQMTY